MGNLLIIIKNKINNSIVHNLVIHDCTDLPIIIIVQNTCN